MIRAQKYVTKPNKTTLIKQINKKPCANLPSVMK